MISTGAMLQDQYLTLLVTQLQNQNPLEPVSQENFITQVTQVSMLSGLEDLNASFSQMLQLQTDILRLQEMSVGNDLTGRIVSYRNGSGVEVQGNVDRVGVVDGSLHLYVGNDRIRMDQVLAVA